MKNEIIIHDADTDVCKVTRVDDLIVVRAYEEMNYTVEQAERFIAALQNKVNEIKWGF